MRGVQSMVSKRKSIAQMVGSHPRLALSLASVAGLASVGSTQAATWTGATNGAWLTSTNWSTGTVPGSGDVATFTTGNTATAVGINMNGATNNGANNQIIGQIELSGGANRTIGNSSTTSNGTLTIAGISGLLIQNTSTFNLVLQDINGSGNKLMGVNLGAGNIDITNTGAVTITSAISGSNGLTKTGTGTGALTVAASSSYTGTTSVLAGTLRFGSTLNGGATGTALGTSTSAILLGDNTGGTANANLFANASANNQFGTSRQVVVQSNNTGIMTYGQGGTGTISATFSGAISLGSVASGSAGHGITLTNGSAFGNTTFSGQITDPASVQAGTAGLVTISGSNGIVLLSGSNTFSGGVNLSSGQLSLNNANALGTGTLTVNGGGFNQQSGSFTMGTANAVVFNSDFTYAAGSTLALGLGSGAYNLGATGTATTRTINTSTTGATLGLGGVVSNGTNGTTVNLTKNGTGNLSLSGASTFSGVTTVNAGQLIIGASSLANTNGPLGNSNNNVLLGNTSGTSSAALVTNPSGTSVNVGRGITVQTNASSNAVYFGSISTSNTVSTTFSGPIVLGSANSNGKGITLANAAYHTTTVSGTIQDPSGLNPGTAGILTIGDANVANGLASTNNVTNSSTTYILSASNSYTGGTIIDTAAATRFANNNAFGTGNLSLVRGSLQMGTGATALAGVSGMSWDGNFSFNSFNFAPQIPLNLGTVNATLTGNRTITIANGTVTMAGNISGSGMSMRVGQSGSAGNFALSGNNSFDGGLSVVPTGTNSLTVTSGSNSALGTGEVKLSNSSLSRVSLNANTTVGSLQSGLNAAVTIVAGSGGTNGTYALNITGGGGSGAAGSATISGNQITSVNFTDIGSGYTSAPTITLSGGGGTGSVTSSFSNSSINLNPGTARTLTIAGTNASPATFAGVISGTNGALIKNGSGTQIFTGSNTYTGATTINGGLLAINGSLASGSAVSVNNGGTLGGSGTIGGAVSVASGGTLAPGNSPGTLTINGTLGLAGSTAIEIDSASSFDKITGVTSYTFGGTLDITLGYTPTAGTTFNIFDGTGGADAIASGGAFTNIGSLTSPGAGLTWDTSDLASLGHLTVISAAGNSVSLTGAVADASSVADNTNPFSKTGHVVAVTGTGGSYTSEIDDLTSNVASGAANIDAVGLEGSIFVMLRLVNGENELTELVNPIDGATVVSASDPQYQALLAQYGGFFNELLRFDSPAANGAFNFDFSSDPSGAVVDQIAVVPEPGAIGLVTLGAIGLISQRRRRKQV